MNSQRIVEELQNVEKALASYEQAKMKLQQSLAEEGQPSVTRAVAAQSGVTSAVSKQLSGKRGQILEFLRTKPGTHSPKEIADNLKIDNKYVAVTLNFFKKLGVVSVPARAQYSANIH